MPKVDSRKSLPVLEKVLEAMLLENENITANRVTRRGPFKHASDITRHPERNALLRAYQAKQSEVRRIADLADKGSKPKLISQLAMEKEKLAVAERQRDLLIASHKAMIRTVGELGGMKAWLRFFEAYQEALTELRKLGAMPTAKLSELIRDEPRTR